MKRMKRMKKKMKRMKMNAFGAARKAGGLIVRGVKKAGDLFVRGTKKVASGTGKVAGAVASGTGKAVGAVVTTGTALGNWRKDRAAKEKEKKRKEGEILTRIINENGIENEINYNEIINVFITEFFQRERRTG